MEEDGSRENWADPTRRPRIWLFLPTQNFNFSVLNHKWTLYIRDYKNWEEVLLCLLWARPTSRRDNKYCASRCERDGYRCALRHSHRWVHVSRRQGCRWVAPRHSHRWVHVGFHLENVNVPRSRCERRFWRSSHQLWQRASVPEEWWWV